MKNLKSLLLILVSLFFVYSCSENPVENDSTISKTEARNNLINFFNPKSVNSHGDVASKIDKSFPFDFEVTENKEIALETSIEYLKSFGVTETDLTDIFGSLDDPKIVISALLTLRIDDQGAAGIHLVDYESNYNYLMGDYMENVEYGNPSIFDCAMDALGVPAALIIGSAQGTSTAAILKAARKLATRTLGWIGAGIAVYEFGDCMDWW